MKGMSTVRKLPAAALLAALLGGATAAQQPSGDLRRWHALALTFQGPVHTESSTPSPFADHRLDVEFRSPGGRVVVVPGYFAADGDAAETGAVAGSAWRVRFVPDEVGR